MAERGVLSNSDRERRGEVWSAAVVVRCIYIESGGRLQEFLLGQRGISRGFSVAGRADAVGGRAVDGVMRE